MPSPRVFVTGASRGIGLEIAKKLASERGAHVTIAAKTKEPHPKLSGTIYTAADEIEACGGKATPLVMDVRDEQGVRESIDTAAKAMGGIDVLINNASAISLTDSQRTKMKTYDLMNNINGRGTYLASAAAIPHLIDSGRQGRNPHILTLSPPLAIFRDSEDAMSQFGKATAYAMAKFAMSLCSLGLAGELRGRVAVNALWPYTLINTEALRLIVSEEEQSRSRTSAIVARCAHEMLLRDSKTYTGNFEIDEIFLLKNRLCSPADIDAFAVDRKHSARLLPDLFVPRGTAETISELRESY
ncbi:uncharacterized protein L969DRAFT_19003 [Mixia osmundae IAM 14324]|uniref:Hydroxysteroid dehydrogenase-like protein 2 n=1 Tax=Mixia osmundae (strain CBS 9802 / IAM 14324 / JCM 22182 / KY 12970) TaxID=764103 RepID=G7DS65_MIXOS|nr:uncharacterized protein L969DRAFT_19003 [Mixia osmundae IAM 14324]KEI37522.1 hypothetical protein L969DRAFT_19003 [Mixia osmundae IAM 14324]GAA93425.1 hypothetical protein E5Q_00066 [Mixia osmundae IAM 14324]